MQVWRWMRLTPLQVRCLANESSMSSKCQRCTRANRECVYTTHSKTRRRKRTDTRVKELEEKVRGLSMLLENRIANSNQSSVETDVLQCTESEEESGTQGQDEKSFGEFGKATNEGFSPLGLPTPEPQSTNKDTESIARAYNESKEPNCGMNERIFREPSPIFPDVIDRGILSMAKATELYDRYVNDLLPLYVVIEAFGYLAKCRLYILTTNSYPAVTLPEDWTAAKLRECRPILFLAVLAASASASKPALNLRLNKEIQQIYATKVAIQGRKSLEICQSMLISILWTYPPDK